MCSDAVIIVHAVYVVLYLYYTLLIYPGKGNSFCRLLETKLSIKSNLTSSTHVMLLIVSRFAHPIYSRIYKLDEHYSSSGGMDTPHQEARAYLFIVQTCNCN